MSEKMGYFESLHDIRWKNKRQEILARDNHTCKRCGKEGCYLEVHHIIYRNGLMAWEYKNNELMSLCQDCHQDISLNIKNGRAIVNGLIHDKEKEKYFIFLLEQVDRLDVMQIAELGSMAYEFLNNPQPKFIPQNTSQNFSDNKNNEEDEDYG